jgi:conserved oligomeric Golgi complex subunit 5
MLSSGVDALGQAEVASALQVFFNLGTLKPIVLQLIEERADDVAVALRSALDARQLTGAAAGAQARGSTGQAGGVRLQDALWQALDESMAKMHAGAIAVWHVQRVVSKKRDPLKLTLFADAIQVSEPSGRHQEITTSILTCLIYHGLSLHLVSTTCRNALMPRPNATDATHVDCMPA